MSYTMYSPHEDYDKDSWLVLVQQIYSQNQALKTWPCLPRKGLTTTNWKNQNKWEEVALLKAIQYLAAEFHFSIHGDDFDFKGLWLFLF